jgi:hypothetical protein
VPKASPGHVALSQARHVAKALTRREKYAGDILKTVLEDRIREVV